MFHRQKSESMCHALEPTQTTSVFFYKQGQRDDNRGQRMDARDGCRTAHACTRSTRKYTLLGEDSTHHRIIAWSEDDKDDKKLQLAADRILA